MNKLALTLFFSLSLLHSNTILSQEKNVEKINFYGNNKTKTKFLKKLIKTKEGKPYNEKKIKLDIDRLERLDGVAHASYTTTKQENKLIVNFKIEENFSIIPGLNIGQANDNSFSYRLSIFEFNGLGQNIIYGGFYKKEVFNSFGLFIEHPYLFSNKLGLGFNYQNLTTQQPIYFPDQKTNYNFTQKGAEILFFYEKDFKNQFEFSTRLFTEEYRLLREDEQNENITNPIEPKANITALGAQHTHTNINTEYHQVKGYINNFNAQYFFNDSSILQTEYIFTNTTSYYSRIGEKGNWASRLQLAVSNEFNNSYFTPIAIDNQLNLRGAGNTINRGTASTALNTEYRHTLIEKKWFVLQSNTFIDIANLKETNQNLSNTFSINKTEIFPGAGIRFIHKKIFNAVLRIDYGFKINGSNNTEKGGIVFGIGQYF